MMDATDVTISKCEDDLSLTIAVGDWFPDDGQMEIIGRAVARLIEGMLPKDQ